MNDILQSDGKTSSIRIAMFMCIGISGYLAVAGLHMGSDMLSLTGLCAMFLSAGIGGKVAQKSREDKQ